MKMILTNLRFSGSIVKSILTTDLLLTIGISISCMSNAIAQDLFGSWHFEGGIYGGMLLADEEIGRDTNSTGGEQLIAKLDNGGFYGLKLGVHSDFIGLEANLAAGSESVKVKNEFGVNFPNHGEPPAIISGDILLYPFGKSLAEGRIRPYFTTGIGNTKISVDLNNRGDQENYNLFTWNAGGGVKYYFSNEQSGYLAFEVKNHRVSGDNPINDFSMQSVTFGLGYRF